MLRKKNYSDVIDVLTDAEAKLNTREQLQPVQEQLQSIDRNQVVVFEVLGSGASGTVYRGQWRPSLQVSCR